MATSRRQAADTERNRRINKLAGCTPLAVELNYARVSVNTALDLHRKAQVIASKPWTTVGATTPAKSRQRVRDAVAKVRQIEAQIEAKWGYVDQPVAAPVFLMAAE